MNWLVSKDFASGLLFIVIGLAVLILSVGYDFGSMARPGPGFFPKILSVLLMLSGASVVLAAVRRPATGLARLAWRPFVLIPLSVVLFSLCIERIGLMPSVFLTATTATYALKSFGFMPRIAIAVCLSVISAVLFNGLLNLPIPLWSF